MTLDGCVGFVIGALWSRFMCRTRYETAVANGVVVAVMSMAITEFRIWWALL